MERFYQLGILPDWWKLPPLSPDRWREISKHSEHYDPECRGILILGLDAPESVVKSGFDAAADMPWVKGFAVGLTIFGEPSRQWVGGQLNDEPLIATVNQKYRMLIDYWREYRPAR